MIGPTDLLPPSPTPHFETFQVFLIYCPKRPSFSTIQVPIHNPKNKFHQNATDIHPSPAEMCVTRWRYSADIRCGRSYHSSRSPDSPHFTHVYGSNRRHYCSRHHGCTLTKLTACNIPRSPTSTVAYTYVDAWTQGCIYHFTLGNTK
jgi:hypothetical protein